MSSIASQNELWDNYKKNSPRQNRSSTAEGHEKTSLNGETHVPGRKLTNMDGSDHASLNQRHQVMLEKYERNMEKIKDAHRIEVQNLTTTFHNKAKDMINNKIEEMRVKFEDEVRNLMSELTRVKIALKEKENQITRLTSMLDEKEIIIEQFERKVEMRNASHNVSRPESQIFLSIDPEDKVSKQDEIIEQLKSQIQSSQALCNMYKEDESKSASELLTTKQTLEQVRSDYEEKMRKLQAESSYTIDVLKEKLTKLDTEFTEYRKASSLEIKILKIIVERYKNSGVTPLEPIRGRSAGGSKFRIKPGTAASDKDKGRLEKRGSNLSGLNKKPLIREGSQLSQLGQKLESSTSQISESTRPSVMKKAGGTGDVSREVFGNDQSALLLDDIGNMRMNTSTSFNL